MTQASAGSQNRDVGLTCGTLIIIALIVHFVGSDVEEIARVEREVQLLRQTTQEVKLRLESVETKLDRLLARSSTEHADSFQLAGSAELAELWRVVLELPGLEQYWHADDPSRVPVRVVPHAAFPAPPETIHKFGQPVLFTSGEELEADPQAAVFRITGCRVFPGGGTVSFEYPVEGVIGTVQLRREGGRWRVQSAEIAER